MMASRIWRKLLRIATAAVILAFVICPSAIAADIGAAAPAVSLAAPKPADTKPADLPGLHNVVAYSDSLYSGAAPGGKAGFQTLRELGVRTVISVDGAVPDVEDAKAEGLHYVHLPIGYNGMSVERTLELSKAVSLAVGPVYIHCHLGKHRSAAAAAAVSVALGKLTNAEAEARMKVAGTAPVYTGLYQCVADAAPAGAQQLAAIPANFPEVWKPANLVAAMGRIELALGSLQSIQKAGWKAPAGHPDQAPAAIAGQLSDLFRNLRDDPEVQQKPAEFQHWLKRESGRFDSIEQSLAADPIEPATLDERLKTAAQSCNDCHEQYRNQAPVRDRPFPKDAR